MMTYLLVTPIIFFFCIADTTFALKRSEASGSQRAYASEREWRLKDMGFLPATLIQNPKVIIDEN